VRNGRRVPATLSRAEGRALFERAVERNLGITAEEFKRRYERGEYDDIDEPKLMNVLILRQFADE
jgi:hypothetical protein